VGVVALGDFSFGGTPRAPSYDFQGKKPKLWHLLVVHVHCFIFRTSFVVWVLSLLVVRVLLLRVIGHHNGSCFSFLF
jgi:hypothetical protein